MDECEARTQAAGVLGNTRGAEDAASRRPAQPQDTRFIVSRALILGCGNIGGIGSAPELFGQGESEEEAFAIMEAAWAAGIRWFDTADAYGGGRSEAAIGKWIRATGNRPRLTTKTYNPMDIGEDHGLAPERVLRQIETSLERLEVERVDLYLAHEFDPETPYEASVGAFERLLEDGTIGAYGVSNFDGAQLEQALDVGRPSVVQNGYSLLERGNEADVIPLCRERGLDFQAFSPLGGGWLTGKYRPGDPPPEGSRMALRPGPYRHLDVARVHAAVERLRERGDPPTLALAWVISSPGISAAVVGPRRPEHLEPALAARELELSPSERDEMASLFA
jgi:aryl-alcohol dehydrogenase-like predicted oxidoreductase